MRPFERNAANLAASLSFYGPAVEQDGVEIITSPVAYSVFNIALLTTPVGDDEGEMEQRIKVAEAHFGRLDVSWTFWVCEDMVGERSARRVSKIFEGRGMKCIAESPGMEMEDLQPPRRWLPELNCVRVGDRTTRSDFAHVVSSCFHIPVDTARRFYEAEETWRHPLKVWLAYHEGLAVTCAAVIAAAGALGIYSVATLEAWRGRGMAERVMRHAIDEERAGGAQGPLVLQSSPAGMELYRRLGFRRVTNFSVYATD